MFGCDVAREIAPDVVSAKMLFLFDQDNFQLGPEPRQCQCDQATGKTATDNCQIAFDIF